MHSTRDIGCLVPDEDQDEASDYANAYDDTGPNPVFNHRWLEFLDEYIRKRTNVGNLDDDDKVGRQVPALGENLDE